MKSPPANGRKHSRKSTPVLPHIESPQDLKALSLEELAVLAQECRDTIVETITKTGGHLASNLGVVELTLALHRAFDSPRDRIVWAPSRATATSRETARARGA